MSTQEADRELKDPDRAELIAEFGRRIGLEEFNLTAWLFLWFSDITALRKRVEDAAGEGFQSISINVFGPGRKPVLDEVLKSCKLPSIPVTKKAFSAHKICCYRARPTRPEEREYLSRHEALRERPKAYSLGQFVLILLVIRLFANR